MKKILTFILTVFMIYSMASMVACKDASTTDSSNATTSTALTESQLKSIAVQELYDSLSIKCGRYGSWNYNIDPSSCKYSIGSIRRGTTSDYEVNGICYFYDKYGSLVTKYSSSGGYSESFTVKISTTGSASIYWN